MGGKINILVLSMHYVMSVVLVNNEQRNYLLEWYSNLLNQTFFEHINKYKNLGI